MKKKKRDEEPSLSAAADKMRRDMEAIQQATAQEKERKGRHTSIEQDVNMAYLDGQKSKLYDL